MQKRPTNTSTILAALNGERSEAGRRLSDPSEVHLVQRVLFRSEEEEDGGKSSENLYVGYNLDGRMVRVVWARREPEEFKHLPHLFALEATNESVLDIMKVATAGGYIETEIPERR